MKHAVLLLAHQHLDHLKDLIRFFDRDFYIFLHIDKRSPFTHSEISGLSAMPGVKLVSQAYKVNWGGLNHLKSILLLSEEALKHNDIDYFHVISGQDYPIKRIDFIKKYFEDHPADYLDHFEVLLSTWKSEWLGRLSHYGLYEIFNSKSFLGNKLINGFILLQKKLGLSRSLPPLTLYGGSGWWSLSRASLKYVMDHTSHDTTFLRRLRFTFCADEIYFQTLLMNSPRKNGVVNNNLRFIDWTMRRGRRPADLDESDYDILAGSDKIFARKFDFPLSQKLKLMIQKDLLQ